MNAETIDLVAAPVSPRRLGTVLLWTGQILLAALFIFGGANKLFGSNEEMLRNFAKLGGDWFRYFVGVLELTGGVGLLIPSLSGLAALELTAVMVGAVGTHLFFQPPAYFAAIPATFAVLLLLVARGRTREIKAVLARLGR
jgi:putative oxidoreductase